MKCCESCGRDTLGRYCSRCVGRYACQVSEAGTRPCLPAPTERGLGDDEDDEPTIAEQYHGDTWRDDL
jgi:hypothetical protein